jgi:acylphosphatase
MSDRVARRVVARGRVQGVWYRNTCRQEALQLGVDGWVRNREDGAVEAALAGPSDAVDALVAWMREGPPHARVSSVETEPMDPDGVGPGFEIR